MVSRSVPRRQSGAVRRCIAMACHLASRLVPAGVLRPSGGDRSTSLCMDGGRGADQGRQSPLRGAGRNPGLPAQYPIDPMDCGCEMMANGLA
jgi:hypothetical protein